jgi:superfamily II DNA or RNA helicase
LTQANRVFLMEPGFNPALEAQAIGRVHRLGQKRNVEICRLVIKDSFESRMVEFLKKKYKLTFDDDSSDGNEREESESDDNEEENDLEMDKEKEKKKKDILEVAQVPVGNLLTERAQIVTEEFDELFGVQGMVNQHGETSDENQDGDAEDNYDAEDDLFPDAAMSGCI